MEKEFKISIIIPSRLSSTRLPDKPLADICGKSLIQRVYEQAVKTGIDDVIVATDHSSIYDHVMGFGGRVEMTSAEHSSGTERVAEVASKLDSDIIINVQGDEPLIDPKQILELVNLMKQDYVLIGTQCARLSDADELFDYNVVKVVINMHHKALYFSRQAIPAVRDEPYKNWISTGKYYKHIGMYGFKKDTLLDLCQLPKSDYERIESLEQLRWLENDYDIYCTETLYSSIGVDTNSDLERVREIVKEMNY